MKRWIASLILIAYGAILIKLMVFKFDLIEIGPLRFKLPPEMGQANFVPFKTIWPYLRGEHGWLIAVLNVAGNIALLVPIGFLVPFVSRRVTWQTSLALAVAVGLAIEGMEVAFRLGIFDIDDVILNALGVMIGYWAFTMVVTRARLRLESA